MTNIVKVTSKQQLQTIEQYYKKQGKLVDRLPPGAIFVAKDTGVTITGYRSNKIMFQGTNAEVEAQKFNLTETNTKTNTNHSATLPENFHTLSVIGSDEVGTGDYFGPFIVASAFCASDQLAYLSKLGVKDSKKLTDNEIKQIAKVLVKEIPYSLLIVHNEKYNELHAKGINQVKMKVLLHNQALYLTAEKIKPATYEAILIDQFVKKETYFSYLKNEKNVIKDRVFFATKGESHHLAVACASIIARASFLQEMDKLSQKIGFPLPKGAGPNVDKTARQIIRTHGEKSLRHYAKVHFANTKKAKGN
ncbi:MAG TPA: ribonuclease HIII [Massilibacterium sp.]|nr:ribonuclease HIII [Massilibacterium sp.]